MVEYDQSLFLEHITRVKQDSSGESLSDNTCASCLQTM